MTKMQIERNDRETTVVEAMLKVPCAGELLGAAVGLVRAADSNSRTNEGTFALLIKAFSLLKQFAEAVCLADTVGETEAEMTQAELLKSKLPEAVEKIHAEKHRLVPDCSSCAAPCGRTEDYDVRRIIDAPPEIRTAKLCLTDSNLNHTGIYLYSKGKIMIHLTFDYKTDEKCTTPGQYLKYHRTFQGLSTRELAEKVGIVPATLVLYENDRHPIKHSTAVALANALGIDRNRLLDKYTAFVDYPYSSLLKKVRQDLSLTQIQMAELIGIGQTSYSGWEREIRVPRRKEYDKILAALEKLRVNVDTYLCQSASI